MGAKKKVLLVDDEWAFIDLTKPILEENGYDVSVAINGEQCRKKVKEDRPDIIILDIMMTTPADGIAVARDLRQDETTRDIPIIVVTSVNIAAIKSVLASNLDELWSPADGMMEKPLEPLQLVEEINNRLKA